MIPTNSTMVLSSIPNQSRWDPPWVPWYFLANHLKKGTHHVMMRGTDRWPPPVPMNVVCQHWKFFHEYRVASSPWIPWIVLDFFLSLNCPWKTYPFCNMSLMSLNSLTNRCIFCSSSFDLFKFWCIISVS